MGAALALFGPIHVRCPEADPLYNFNISTR